MVEYIVSWYDKYGFSDLVNEYIAIAITILFMLFVSLVLMKVAQLIINKIIKRITRFSRLKWNKYLWDRKVFQKLSRIIPALVVYWFSSAFPKSISNALTKLASVFVIYVAVQLISALLDTVNDVYITYDHSKYRPIKGYLQVVKILVYVVGGIQVIAVLMDKNPLLFLSGIGAFSAVLMLVFQDSLLGLVSGIQLSSNDMVRIGDWIEIPQYGIDGNVIEITLNTVKIKNFDNTISTIPTYTLVSNTFKNWRGMTETGTRRIKRSVIIDLMSVGFCTGEMLEKYSTNEYLRDFLSENREKMTNIRIFREYVKNYLKRHPYIDNKMTIMVRQLPQQEKGLPIEIYAFSKITDWEEFESVQTEIFEHVFSVIPEFNLRAYQQPSSYDLSKFLQ